MQTAPTTTTDSDHSLTLVYDRVFKATPEEVFAAWTDPEQLAQWWGPQGMTCPLCELDVRKGGRYRTTMRSKEGSDYTVSGEYLEVERPSRLSFTWAWEREEGRGHETVVTVELSPHREGTLMRFEQRTFKEVEHRAHHDEGWTSTWKSLDEYLKA